MKNIFLIAQEFKWPSNCGALARAAANFNCSNLIFLNPQCDYKGKEALMHAKHAACALSKSKKVANFHTIFKQFDYIIGTTSMLGTDYNIARTPISPEQLAKLLELAPTKKVAIIIGREGEGMSNEEIRKCDFVVTIPTSKKYPTMNVSHAASIILYELFKHFKEDKIGTGVAMASGKEKEVLLHLLDSVLVRLPFTTEEKRETQRILWKRLIGKAMLTRREAYGLCGFFKKIKTS